MHNVAVPPRLISDAQFSNLLISRQAEFQATVTVPEPTLASSAANKEYVDGGGGGGTPGLPFNSVQFNNTGVFAGTSDFLWDNTLKQLTVHNFLNIT